MDSSALFIVGSLVREMMGICANVADLVENENPIFAGRYIEQIFILTHNAYFHQQIVYDQVDRLQIRFAVQRLTRRTTCPQLNFVSLLQAG